MAICRPRPTCLWFLDFFSVFVWGASLCLNSSGLSMCMSACMCVSVCMHLCAAGWDLYQRARWNKNPALLCRITQQAINKSIFDRYSIWMALLNWTDIWMLQQFDVHGRYYANLTNRNRFTTNKLTSHEAWDKSGNTGEVELTEGWDEREKGAGWIQKRRLRREGEVSEEKEMTRDVEWDLENMRNGAHHLRCGSGRALTCGERCSWCEGEEIKSQEKDGVIKKREQ